MLAHNVSGRQVHDAHLVALMQAYSITSILTFTVNCQRVLNSLKAGIHVAPPQLQFVAEFLHFAPQCHGKLCRLGAQCFFGIAADTAVALDQQREGQDDRDCQRHDLGVG